MLNLAFWINKVETVVEFAVLCNSHTSGNGGIGFFCLVFHPLQGIAVC